MLVWPNKYNSSILLVILCFLILSSCSSNKILTGKLYYSGNEPFKQISLELKDNTGITICDDSPMIDSLKKRINSETTVEVQYQNKESEECYRIIKIIK